MTTSRRDRDGYGRVHRRPISTRGRAAEEEEGEEGKEGEGEGEDARDNTMDTKFATAGIGDGKEGGIAIVYFDTFDPPRATIKTDIVPRNRRGRRKEKTSISREGKCKIGNAGTITTPSSVDGVGCSNDGDRRTSMRHGLDRERPTGRSFRTHHTNGPVRVRDDNDINGIEVMPEKVRVGKDKVVRRRNTADDAGTWEGGYKTRTKGKEARSTSSPREGRTDRISSPTVARIGTNDENSAETSSHSIMRRDASMLPRDDNVMDSSPLCDVDCSRSNAGADIRVSYRVGEALRHECHSLPPSAYHYGEFDDILLSSRMPLGSHIFVRRTSGTWTYATLMGRDPNGETLTISLESTRTARKILARRYWWECLRLVNDNAVAVASDDDPPRFAASPRATGSTRRRVSSTTRSSLPSGRTRSSSTPTFSSSAGSLLGHAPHTRGGMRMTSPVDPVDDSSRQDFNNSSNITKNVSNWLNAVENHTSTTTTNKTTSAEKTPSISPTSVDIMQASSPVASDNGPPCLPKLPNNNKRRNILVRSESDVGLSRRDSNNSSNVTVNESVNLNPINDHTTMTKKAQSISLSSVAMSSSDVPPTQPVTYRSEDVDPPPLSGNADIRVSYRVGEALRREHHSIPPSAFREDEFVHLLSSRMPLGSHLFVRRSIGAWTYAKLVRRHKNGETLSVSLESTRDARKVLNKKYWWRCLRLVNDNAVVASDDDPPFFVALPGAIPMSASSSKDPFLSGRDNLVRSAPDLASPCRDFHNSWYARSDSTISFYDPQSSDSQHLDLDGMVSDSPVASDASFLAAVATIIPRSATGLSNSIRSAPDMTTAHDGLNCDVAHPRPNDRRGIHMHVSVGFDSLDGLVKNSAVGCKSSSLATVYNKTPSSATGTWTTATSSSVLSNASHAYSRKNSAPELRHIRSWGSIDSNVMVNLNARTFIGNRRDRFRPREQQRSRSNCSGLSRLGELL
ncbi:hypothetical protein ACHAXA_009144 [Cyclostephanos tholiformis]|uniref:Uncharacterized protein n=1 Tax=Cyclostephanos tholiformis TaxID=382380 RepID=A0ABD3RWU9_9STRA